MFLLFELPSPLQRQYEMFNLATITVKLPAKLQAFISVILWSDAPFYTSFKLMRYFLFLPTRMRQGFSTYTKYVGTFQRSLEKAVRGFG